jgi:hypothetical protein
LKAYCLIREQPAYRRDAFVAGLKKHGYEVVLGPPVQQKTRDILVTWNRYGEVEQRADQFEANGGTVLVAENGYINGRHEGGDYYALAKHGHNGSGDWYVGGRERWDALGVELKPWRATGGHILVAPSRSFGKRGTVMPFSWADDVTRRLQEVTDRPIRLRQHPANGTPSTPLGEDLRDCWAVVVWHSTVGVRALIDGIPVICESSAWVMKDAFGVYPEVSAVSEMERQLVPLDYGHRDPAWWALAWAQWSVREIAAGIPFEYLLAKQEETV